MQRSVCVECGAIGPVCPQCLRGRECCIRATGCKFEGDDEDVEEFEDDEEESDDEEEED